MNWKLLAKSIGVGVGSLVLIISAVVGLNVFYDYFSLGAHLGVVVLLVCTLGIVIITAVEYYNEHK